MQTIDQIRSKIRKNFPKEMTGSEPKAQKLRWNRETQTSLVSSCGLYRINRVSDSEEGTVNYWASICATLSAPPKNIAGPFNNAKEAREAAQAHLNGEPMQANLTPVQS